MAHGRDRMVEVDCEVIRETDRAYLIDTGDPEQRWIPKSLCYWDESGTMTIPEWMAVKKGLI